MQGAKLCKLQNHARCKIMEGAKLSHYWPFTKANLVLEDFNKNLGFGQTPPPWLGQMPKFSRKSILKAPLMHCADLGTLHSLAFCCFQIYVAHFRTDSHACFQEALQRSLCNGCDPELVRLLPDQCQGFEVALFFTTHSE